MFPGSVQPYPGTGTVVAAVPEPTTGSSDPVPVPIIICPVQLVAKVESVDSADGCTSNNDPVCTRTMT
jgi:hypothetical protein